jgi:hypothetical protein
MIPATTRSGHAAFSKATKPAAVITAILASASLRLNSQIARAFASPPSLKRISASTALTFTIRPISPEATHEIGFGDDGIDRAPDCGANDAKAQGREEAALDQGHSRTGMFSPRQGKQAHQRDRAVTKKIERIGFESLAPCEESADKLHHAEAEVEQDDNPQRSTVGGIGRGAFLIRVAATADGFV